jgi:hypothetical protein
MRLSGIAWQLLVGIILVSTWSGTASAQAQNLAGSTGQSGQFNSSWFDLTSPWTFNRGDRLQIILGANPPRDMIVRFVPVSCSPQDPCDILENCKLFHPRNGVVEVIVPRRYENIKQISVHSGVSGRAWHCPVNGGQISPIIQIDLTQAR